MIIQVSNKIHIKNPHSRLVTKIKRELAIDNPMYQVMKRKNPRACYNIPEKFEYYSTSNDVISIGRGNMGLVLDVCKEIDTNIKYQDKTVNASLSDVFVSDRLVLRDYQEGVPEEIVKRKIGTIKLGTGFGKTIISLKMIELLQKKTLIIVPRSSILKQFQKEITKYYNYNCGVIQGKTWDIRDITVASISTLQKRDLSEIKDKFGMVIVDEAHTMITDARLKVIQAFNPERLYGLTATPRRTDKQGDAIFFTFGKIIIDRKLEQVKPQVMMVATGASIAVQEYADMVTDMVYNEKRNEMIVESILHEVSDGRRALVLTKRIEHFNILNNHLSGADPDLKIYTMSSHDKQEDRDDLLLRLRDGESDFDIIMGTMSLLSTGTDIPALDTLFFVGDLKSDVLQEQGSGRVLRVFKNKKDPLIVDFVDNLNPIFTRHAKFRQKFYESMGWELI